METLDNLLSIGLVIAIGLFLMWSFLLLNFVLSAFVYWTFFIITTIVIVLYIVFFCLEAI
jgi:hypothetical protein